MTGDGVARWKPALVLLTVLLAGLPGLLGDGPEMGAGASQRTVAAARLPIQGEGGIGAADVDFTGELVPVLERDTIQALDLPASASGIAAARWAMPDELVLGVVIDGNARAYPLRVLGAHEVVNDEIAGQHVLVTFCPLCFTGIAYDRRVGRETRTFGVSGFLLNSSLVLFDRETDTLWSQVTGEALNGVDEGRSLIRVPAMLTDWRTWLDTYPATTILDVDALGGGERYPADRFDGYFGSSASGLIPLETRSDLPDKALVAGVIVNGVAAAFDLSGDESKVVQEMVGGKEIAVWINGPSRSATAFFVPRRQMLELMILSDGTPALAEQETGERWDARTGVGLDGQVGLEPLQVTVSFWFGWAAFYPETELRVSRS